MVAKDLEDLKKLSPRERLRKLRELQKKNKEEIEKAQDMMRESEREIEIEEGLKDIPIPQVKAVDVQSLFSPEEKEVFRMKRFAHKAPNLIEEEAQVQEQSLEETVAEEAEQREITTGPHYGAALDEAKELMNTLVNAYGAIKELANGAEQGTLSADNAARLASYAEAAQQVYQAGVEPTEELHKVVHETERLLYTAQKQLKGESGLREDYIL